MDGDYVEGASLNVSGDRAGRTAANTKGGRLRTFLVSNGEC
jgi:hypothetical protein